MVEHPNYYKTDLRASAFTYGASLAGDALPLPTSEKPAIFTLHSKGRSEFLIHHQSIKFRLPIDETPVKVDLRNGGVDSDGEAVVLILHSDGNKLPINQYYPFDWSLKIRVPGGGLQERVDQFQFQAPVEGYRSEIAYSMRAATPKKDWKESLENEFFVVLSSGNYARIKISMLAVKGACQIEIFFNRKSGSRNLEYDPSKTTPLH